MDLHVMFPVVGINQLVLTDRPSPLTVFEAMTREGMEFATKAGDEIPFPPWGTADPTQVSYKQWSLYFKTTGMIRKKGGVYMTGCLEIPVNVQGSISYKIFKSTSDISKYGKDNGDMWTYIDF